MASRNTPITVRPAQGGLDNSSDPTTLDPNFLTVADNLEYQESGQRRKRQGTLPYSASSSTAGTFTGVMVTSSSNVRALGDIWVYGNTLTPTQTLVAVTSASIFRSTGDGTWTAVTTASSFGTNALLGTDITMAEDKAVIADGVTAPIAFNPASTTLVAASTGAAWPVFSQSVFHLARLFMTGLSTAASKVVYSAAGNIFDSTGVDAGTFNLDPGDGDRIMGVSRPYFGNLYFFKGPQFGSAWQLSGLTPSAFAVQKIISGAPVINPKAIVTTPTDIFWMSAYGVHSLQTTIKYGDVEQAYISHPIQNFWREPLLNQSDLHNSQAFWQPTRNIVGWTITPNNGVGTGQGARSWVLVYNYALSDPSPTGKKYWAVWKFPYGINAMAQIIGPSGGFQPLHVGDPHLWFASDQGMVYEGNYPFLEDDGQAITSIAKTPILTRIGQIPETSEKTFFGVTTYFADEQSAESQYSLQVDIDGRQQVDTFTRVGTDDVLG